MSVQEGFHHPPIRSHRDAHRERVRGALRRYGALSEAALYEVLCPGRAPEPCVRAALNEAVRRGEVRKLGDVYATR